MSHDELNVKFDINCNFLEVLQVRQSIPLAWRSLLNTVSLISNVAYNGLYIDGYFTQLHKLEGRHLYWALFDKMKKSKPKCIFKWEEYFDIDPQNHSTQLWEKLFLLPFVACSEPYLQSFQYKILHRIIPCNHWLHTMKIAESSNCQHCHCDDDTISHFFIHCDSVTKFWKDFSEWLSHLFKTVFVLDEPTVLFGYDQLRTEAPLINYLLVISKWFIYISKQKGNSINIYKFYIFLKNKIELKFLHFTMKDELLDFEYKWGHLYQSLRFI